LRFLLFTFPLLLLFSVAWQNSFFLARLITVAVQEKNYARGDGKQRKARGDMRQTP
jgi:hypothetical protein